MSTPEDQARESIDDLLTQADWVIQDPKQVNLSAGRGVVIRNFPLEAGHGFADYLFYIEGLLNNRVIECTFCYTVPRPRLVPSLLTPGAAHVPNGNG